MILARELREKREKYKITIKGELNRIEKVLEYFNPETDEEIVCQLYSDTFYEVKKNLEDRGFIISLTQAYKGITIDQAVTENKGTYITVIINF